MIAENLLRWAEKQKDKTALQIKRGDEYSRVTYQDLWKRSLGAASRLAAAGVAEDDRVALFAGNGSEWVIAYFGIHLAGAVAVPIDAQYGPDELRVLLNFSEAKAILVDSSHKEAALKAQTQLNQPLEVWSIDEPNPDPSEGSDIPSILDESVQSDFTYRQRKPEDVMSIIFTSGTTGDPKGVQLTCGNICGNIEAILKGIHISKKDNILNFLPLHHAYASTVGVFALLYAGGTVTFSSSLRGPDLLAAMQETGVTIFLGVPQVFKLMEQSISHRIDSLGFGPRIFFNTLYGISHRVRTSTGIRLGGLFFRKIKKQFGPKFRLCASGGAKLDSAISERFLDLGVLMLEGYGLTETSPVISFTPASKPKPGTVGRPLEDVQIRIDNPNDGGQGEICMRGVNLMKGYYKKEQATAEVIRDGWFHTGDLGYIDSDGMLVITGRAKEVIVLPSGKNIYPDEVELHYESCPLIKEICITQTKAEDGSYQGLCAVVVPNMEELAARKAANINERLRSELAIIGASLPSYMRINDLVLFDEPFPRTRLGKLRRAKIDEMVENKKRAGKTEMELEISPEIAAMMEHPQSQKFLKRLAELTDKKGPFSPSQDLEIDLGIDSLTQVQLTLILDEEFGVKVPEDAFVDMRTVGDVLKKLLEGSSESFQSEATLSWAKRLKEPAAVTLDEMFNTKRGVCKRAIISTLRFCIRMVLRIVFRVHVEGMKKIPLDGSLLICPNHQSLIDPVLIFAMLPGSLIRRAFFVGFQDIFRRPPMSWAADIGRVILTGGASTWAESLKLSAEVLRRGDTLCIFPEGGRTTTGDIMDPKSGAGILARETRSAILPVLIEGATETLSTMNPGFRACRIRIKIGDVIPPVEKDAFSQEDYEDAMKRWREIVTSLQTKQDSKEISA